MAPCASKFETTPCGTIAHPWCPDSCLKGAVMMMTSSTLGSLPFVSLFYLVKLILKPKQDAQQSTEIKKLPARVFRTTLFAACLAGGIVAGMCFLRRVLGRFYESTIGFYPGCIGGLSIFTQHKNDTRVFVDALYLMAVEYGVRKTVMSAKRSLTLETLVFSAVSGLLSFLQRTAHERTCLPWFHCPERQREDLNINGTTELPPMTRRKPVWPLQRFVNSHHADCKHEGGCVTHAMDGTVKFFILGSALSIARGILPRIYAMYVAKSQRPLKIRPFLGWSLPSFLAAYVALFRISRCSLCWVYNEDGGLHSAAAGAIAGISYTLNPSLSLLAAALASSSELTWNFITKLPVIPKWLHSCPRLIVVIAAGLLIHAKIYEPKNMCPPVGSLILSAYSRGRADEMLLAYHKISGN